MLIEFYNFKNENNIHSNVSFHVSKDCTNVSIMTGSAVDNFVTIGDYTYVGSNCFLTNSEIGRYSSIGNDVIVGPGEHDYRRISTSSKVSNISYNDLTEKECKIGNDVWIGAKSIILRGVAVGDGAVIGAGSVVTKDIPPFAIAVGVPARVIKYRFSENEITKILDSKWWNLDLQEARGEVQRLGLILEKYEP
jgi:acetyltransferase-like isoleucine patch superfamily enzyme